MKTDPDKKITQAKDMSEKLDKFLSLTPLLAAGAFLIVLTAYIVNFNGPLTRDREAWGQFGDYIGGSLNPILSFITIIILLTTTRIQKKELREAQEGLAKSNAALNKQCEILNKQVLENTFFQLLEDFKKDQYIKRCLESSQEIHLGIYQIWRDSTDKVSGTDTKDPNEQWGKIYSGVFSNVLITKIDLMFKVIKKLDDEKLYSTLITTFIGPHLTASLCQYCLFTKDPIYKRFKEVGVSLENINVALIYMEEAIDDLSPKQANKFREQKEEILRRLDFLVKLEKSKKIE